MAETQRRTTFRCMVKVMELTAMRVSSPSLAMRKKRLAELTKTKARKKKWQLKTLLRMKKMQESRVTQAYDQKDGVVSRTTQTSSSAFAIRTTRKPENQTLSTSRPRLAGNLSAT